MSGTIPRYEQAPVTDAEWAEALRDYCRERAGGSLDPDPETRSAAFSNALLRRESDRFSSPSIAGPSSSPLIHDSSALDDCDDRQSMPSGPLGSFPRQSSHDPSKDLEIPLSDRNARGSFGSESSAASEDGACAVPLTLPKSALPEGATKRGDDDRRTAVEERARLRAFYETNGWLPGPEPSPSIRIRRRAAIQKLGLSGADDAETARERRTVISRYAEMAQQIFNVRDARVLLIRDGEEWSYSAHSDEDPETFSQTEGAVGHLVLSTEEKCFVLANMGKDWRFRANPVRDGYGTKFFAAAPLRLQRKDTTVDFGAIILHDQVERDTFDAREQGILLKLANMLVYQLSTLQSDIVAKRSASMYEACILYLRRSVMRDTPLQKRSSKRRDEKIDETETPWSGKRERSSSPRPRPTPQTAVGPPRAAVKTGPREAKDAKIRARKADVAQFADAAATLRRIFHADGVAMVGLEDYQIFLRKTNDVQSVKGRTKHIESKDQIIADYLSGKPWPADIEPVIHVPKGEGSTAVRLSTDHAENMPFNLSRPGGAGVVADFLKRYLQTRHYWWDREDTNDPLAAQIMALMPDQCQTALGTAFITPDGTARFLTFVTWNRPPSTFGDFSTAAMPFVWIMGGCTMAAAAIRKVRELEKSQISYSNLQAHELRTPLHQILAITQLLRSAMTDLAETPQTFLACSTTTEQIRDLLPLLDAIDTSGKILHGIVDNILSFLDLKSKDNGQASLLNAPSGAAQSLETMFEELIHEACEEDKRSRSANGQPLCHVETIFEVIPPLLGEKVTEDVGGALRRALSKILSNAYKFIDHNGSVEIYVDDVPGTLPPEGCEDLSCTKQISITIIDSGRGMDASFVRDKLGEPWAKEDQFATGSGLSVHLAYRIVDLMGGHMEITSSPNGGTCVVVEVPVPRRDLKSMSPLQSPGPSSPNPSMLDAHPDHLHVGRKVALVGFEGDEPGVSILGRCLARQYQKLGCQLVDPEDAELVVAEGGMEEHERGSALLERSKSTDIVFLVTADHSALQDVKVLERKLGKHVRRFMKPATPSILRESLFPGQAHNFLAEVPVNESMRKASLTSPVLVDPNGRQISADGKPKAHFEDSSLPPPPVSGMWKWGNMWKPKGMCIEDAVASLSLGDYFSSHRQNPLHRTSSNSSGGQSNASPSTPTIGSSLSEGFSPSTPPSTTTPSPPYEEAVEQDVPEVIKVLVVEDNMVNRKILVRILSSQLSKKQDTAMIEVCEAEDGAVAVELFRGFTSPAIVLLDINMPKMDGYQACSAMRALEKAAEARGRSLIIAVTALAGEAERRRGLVESGMDQWLTKPCGKATITKVVEEARKELLGLM